MKADIKDIGTSDLQKKLRPRPVDGHKGTFGHAALIVGAKGMAGAAVLAAEACLRSGIGKLTLCTPEENRVILQIAIPEAIVTDHYDWHISYEAVGIGPGMGIHPERLQDCLNHTERPIVIDADAINTMAVSQYLWDKVPQNSIITPHPGEARRLIGSTDLKDVVNFAVQHKVFVVLKGHPTHVCTPDGSTGELKVGNAGMATAGSGDVLTGIVTGLLAQGYPPHDAALLGVWLHGTAGDIARDEMGENCMLARDIIRFMPEAFKRLRS